MMSLGGYLKSVKTFAFRTDASDQIGTGHFMRCLALADELQKQGAQICFITRNLPVHLSEMLNTKRMDCIPLITKATQQPIDELVHSNWLGTSQFQDAQATLQALVNQSWDWVVVDHYGLDKRWEAEVRANCKKLMVIDDLADRQHDCDVLLDQNFYVDMQTRYLGKVPEDCQLLLGPRYALLREEFRVLREKVKVRAGDIKKILIFFGGVDADNFTSLAIQASVELNSKLQVDIVIGAQHPNLMHIQQLCSKHGFVCHIQTTHMAELMAEADLAIGAGGSASWERCCLGLPGLLLAVAENQVEIAKALDSIGVCYYLGEGDVINLSSLKDSINKFLVTPDQLMAMSQQAFSLVDGLGVKRVFEALSS